MSTDIEFVEGIYFKEPRASAPDYVKGSISIQPKKLAAWLQAHISEEWVNVDVKESKGGKIYCAVNDWKSNAQRANHANREQARDDAPTGDPDDVIPF